MASPARWGGSFVRGGREWFCRIPSRAFIAIRHVRRDTDAVPPSRVFLWLLYARDILNRTQAPFLSHKRAPPAQIGTPDSLMQPADMRHRPRNNAPDTKGRWKRFPRSRYVIDSAARVNVFLFPSFLASRDEKSRRNIGRLAVERYRGAVYYYSSELKKRKKREKGTKKRKRERERMRKKEESPSRRRIYFSDYRPCT